MDCHRNYWQGVHGSPHDECVACITRCHLGVNSISRAPIVCVVEPRSIPGQRKDSVACITRCHLGVNSISRAPIVCVVELRSIPGQRKDSDSGQLRKLTLVTEVELNLALL